MSGARKGAAAIEEAHSIPLDTSVGFNYYSD